MFSKLDLLKPEFKKQVLLLLQACAEKGIIMNPWETMRTPVRQAKLWKQSRNNEEIQNKIDYLQSNNAEFLALCLEKAIPRPLKQICTNALPGLSWHQWGEAIDCCWIVGDNPVWDLDTKINGVNGFEIYANEAKKLGLESGLFWNIKDATHVQMRNTGNPEDLFSLQYINDLMASQFKIKH